MNNRHRKLKQGERLAELRKAAGLSQHELARLIGERQSNIAFWEHSDKPPRSEVIPKMAHVLGVRVEDLLCSNGKVERQAGPIGKVRKVFDEVSTLPKRQQEKIVEVVSVFVRQYQQEREGKL